MSVEADLHAERAGHLELAPCLTVTMGTRVAEVLRQMRAANQNCVLITGYDGQLAGIFTERDVLHKVLLEPGARELNIEALMTPSPRAVRTEDSVAVALRLMNEGHFRHVPVLDRQGRLVGNLNYNAIIRFLCDRLPTVTYNLSPDPERVARAPEGA